MEHCAVDVWMLCVGEEYPLILSPDEQERADRFHFEQDRIHWSRARSFLKTILSHYTGQAPEAIRFSYGEHGKPELAPPCNGLQFNLSHAGDWATIAITRSKPVGIDIERIRPNVDIAALLRRLNETDLPNTISELFQTWARREARSKAAGGPLFAVPDPAIHAVNIDAPEGYAAAVAIAEGEPLVRYCDLR